MRRRAADLDDAWPRVSAEVHRRPGDEEKAPPRPSPDDGSTDPGRWILNRAPEDPWDNESDEVSSNSAGWGARLLMVPALVFFGVAVLLGCLFHGIVRLRLGAVARQPDVSNEELCELKQANRITSAAVIASLVGLAVVGVAYLVF